MGSGFSGGEWLCCSLFALIAHFSPQNLLTLHAYYQHTFGDLIIHELRMHLKKLLLERMNIFQLTC
jgi:hypothetical protein